MECSVCGERDLYTYGDEYLCKECLEKRVAEDYNFILECVDKKKLDDEQKDILAYILDANYGIEEQTLMDFVDEYISYNQVAYKI